MKRRAFLAAAGVAVTGTAAASLVTGGGDGDATASALVAGSLQSVAGEVPDGSVEAHGSVTCRQYVLDDLRDPDALALADPVLFEGIAEPTLFATNALVLAGREGALPEDWRAAVRRDDVKVGRTDPQQDPLGYRTVLALRLSDLDADEHLPDMPLFPETSMLRTLESGGLDAAFCYRNMAEDHDLPYRDLPPEIDFSDPERADEYAEVSIEVNGEAIRGAPITYGAAALTDAGEPWTESLVTGRDRLEAAGFTVPSGFPERPR
ncbi:substrate-binding domain-containing protein [Halobacterium litoreum]|uniref:Substrate-binding domain-containing protein n=1 Tax=Halobacterium litoreum TaxID=2039234 RepID=A0ABD5NBZ0_9EURY|nr:substrate-binding domain-containing protein [Halobacterium litoreum]UHH14325.1 substrate-binding domain-containing protein [Halobacterium litoreum]